jgi:hypothetical protein
MPEGSQRLWEGPQKMLEGPGRPVGGTSTDARRTWKACGRDLKGC